MASHLFVKPHRRLPAEDTFTQRIIDRGYAVAVFGCGMVADGLEYLGLRIRAAWRARR
ncbi:hypothetical protein L332_03705 [Agrococcus pavilionensis RW1]|uniref:Uncharacterized protein n=1 Tax=Agrococcus pavilionensis RW1 TaxID=1330458 RepID=U1MNT2_9MICO|nr:hypothetical protein L332_03705 [Agrococcus pavilionensis RW1]